MNEGNAPTCPICKLNDDLIVHKGSGLLARRTKCPRCKEFIIFDLIEFTAPDSFFGPKLSAWIRDSNEQHAEVPKLTTDTLEDLQKGLPNYGPREKQIILLQNIERKTAYPGKPVEIIPKYDIPLAWASTEEEFLYYINSLIERGFLKKPGPTTRFDMLFSVVITADGWDYLEQHERHIEERTQAFVAMSFSEDLKSIWEGPIRNAIKKAGYKPYRVDAEPHNELIDFKIISAIKNSRFVVADFTGQKHGVYFEAGYARGIGLPVIWCVRKDDFKNLHFDTNHYNHIQWETPNELEDQLYQFICEIVGKRKET
jgi:nucleoside 2-deoxyribosyltransferase